MITTILGEKVEQSQRFLEDGRRIPVTIIHAGGNVVSQIKTKEIHGKDTLQLGFGKRKKVSKAIAGHIKKAGLTNNPRFFREILGSPEALSVGSLILVSDVFKPGDVVKVTGTSKGKGFAGGVKKHHFKGGPRTHGQSDRERAPGSIGQTTTPGRVYRGKRMAGRMGDERVTVKNIQVVEVLENQLLIGGLVPGKKRSLVIIQKTGENKKFVPLFKEKTEEVSETKEEESAD